MFDYEITQQDRQITRLITEKEELQRQLAAAKETITMLERRVVELREMLSARGAALGLGK